MSKIGTEAPQYKGAYPKLIAWLRDKSIPFVQAESKISFIAPDESPVLGWLEANNIGATAAFGQTHNLYTIALSQFI